MQVGELFVSLGVKGSDKTVQAFTQVQSGLGKMQSMSLETKAALIGAFYAFQQLVSASNQLGTNLKNTSSLLGIDVKTLQEYGFAAQMVGSNLQEMEGALKGIQSQFAKLRLNEGAPKWLGEIARVTGKNIDASQIENFKKNPQDFIQLLQRYAGLEKDEAKRNEVLSQFVGSDSLKSGLVQGIFNKKTFQEADKFIYSKSQIDALDSIRREWTKLGIEIERSIGGFNAKYGKQLIGDIREITHSVLQLIEAFLSLDKSMHVLQAIDLIFKGWTEIFGSLKTLVDAFSGDKSAGERVKSALSPILGSRGPEPSEYGGGATTVNQYFQLPPNANLNDYKNAMEKMGNKIFGKRTDAAGRQNLGQTGAPR